MRQSHLKQIRVAIALIFLLSMTFLLIDFRKLLPEQFYDSVLWLQFIPSILKFISTISIVTTGFIVVLVLAGLFGRIYCSVFCPLGILQDSILWIKRRVYRKSRYRFSQPINYLRYPLLALPVITWLAGTIIFVSLLDPFSNFGRIISGFIQPVYIFSNNAGARLLEKLNIFFLYPENILMGRWLAYLFPVIILVLVTWMSLKRGRLYCNTVCPVGTLLGLLSRISLLRIRIAGFKCTKCGNCVSACKSECININNQEVDFSRCVGCFNCIHECPEDAIKYTSLAKHDFIPVEPDAKRRKVLISGALLLLSLLGFRKAIIALSVSGSPEIAVHEPDGTDKPVQPGQSRSRSADEDKTPHQRGSDNKTSVPRELPRNKIPTKIEPDKNYPVTPPGSLGINHFTDACTACHLCVSACPTRVLQPSLLEYGITGWMQPFMDYVTNYCHFECVICCEVCPTGAILSLSGEAKKTVQIGKVNLILENCVVKTDLTACGACAEQCPTQAVHMIPYMNELTIPEIRQEICVGCGACEYSCPTRPFRAIYVDGNPVHQVALLPEEKALEEVPSGEDFPF